MGFSKPEKKDFDHEEQEQGREERGGKFSIDIIFLLKHALHIVSCTVLSLLLPLSLLLLARLTPSSAAALSPLAALLYVDLPLFHALVTFVFSAAAVHVLTSHHLYRPPNAAAWAFLCLMQASVTISIEATLGFRPTAASTGGVFIHHKGQNAIWVKQAVLYVGVYTTMRFWRKIVVKPVVDGTLQEVAEGCQRRGRRTVDKLVLSVAFAALWVAMAQHEVAAMVFETIEGRLRFGMAWDSYARWLIAHAMVMTGIARIIQGILWLVRLLALRLCKVEDEEEEGLRIRIQYSCDQV